MKIQDRVKYGVGVFKSLGLSQNQALGALGSMMGESGRGLRTDAHNPNDPGDGAFGIAQWHSDRRRGLEKFAKKRGTKVTDFKTQMDYVAYELQTTHKDALAKIKGAKSLDQAARSWTLNYEKPAPKYRHHDRRTKNAQYAAGLLGGVDVDPTELGSIDSEEDVTDNAQAMQRSTPKGPFDDVLGLLDLGTNTTLREIGEVGKMGLGLVRGKDVLSNAGGLLGKIPGADDPNNPLGAISSFLTEATPGMKIGSIAGGIIGGPSGTLVGGLLGQGLNMMLREIAAEQARNTFPDKPDGGVQGNGKLTDYGKQVMKDSPQAKAAWDSGKTGLW